MEWSTLFGSLLRGLGGTAAGGACGLGVAEFWTWPANLAVVDSVSISLIWIGVIAGNLWSRAYVGRMRRAGAE
jgi:hypothetical protein